jgi:hypothetical protein
VARHRSPRGRRAHPLPTSAAPGRATADGGAHRSVPTPLKRGAAVIAVAGGALSLTGAAGAPPTVIASAALSLPTSPPTSLPTSPPTSLPAEAPAALEPSVVPVVPEPDVVDATRLVATVQRIERQLAEARAAAERKAAEARKAAAAEKARAEAAIADCGLDLSGLGAVTRGARTAAQFLGCRFGEPTTYGVAGRAGTSDHPSGKALDFMVDPATGDRLAACALENIDAFGITYVIWEQRINYGSGWERMEDRGGATANHMDHVHVSFGSGAGDGPPTAC